MMTTVKLNRLITIYFSSVFTKDSLPELPEGYPSTDAVGSDFAFGRARLI